jgi:hypothetical protein
VSLARIPNTVLDADRLAHKEAGIGNWIGHASRRGILGSSKSLKPGAIKGKSAKAGGKSFTGPEIIKKLRGMQ